MRGRDEPRNTAKAGIEPETANIVREANLRAGRDRPERIAKRGNLEYRFGLDDLDVLRRHAKPRHGGPNQPVNAAVEDTNDDAATGFIGVGEHHAGQLEHREQTLIQRFEIRTPRREIRSSLCANDTVAGRSARRKREHRHSQQTKM
jgi:hypothetical protein